MNVAIVVHDFDSNFGQGRYCVELAKRLAGRIRLTIYAGTWRPEEVPPGVQVKRIPAWRARALTTVYSFILPAELAVRRGRHDVIHAQGLSCWNADVITGHMCNAARLKHTPMEQAKQRRFMRMVIPVERRFFQQHRANRLIAISRALGREIQEEYGWSRATDVIFHGTNTDQFRPCADGSEKAALRRELGVAAGGWVWTFVGEAVKGLKETIDQLVNFPKAQLLVATRSVQQPFEQQAIRLGVRDRIVFRGFDSRPERIFRAADVFVYPNRYDPFGMVGTEAMASGCVAVLGKNIGVAELVIPGKNGLWCDPDDPEDLRRQLDLLETDRNRAAVLAEAGRTTVLKHSWDACADATLKSYEASLAARRKRPS